MTAILKAALVATVMMAALSGCATSQPAADDEESGFEVPAGWSFDESYIGGSWVRQPSSTPGDCGLANPDDTYCWSTDVMSETGCKKGFAFTWVSLDAYGDQVGSGRERILHVEKGVEQTVTFRGDDSELVDEVKIKTAGCI